GSRRRGPARARPTPTRAARRPPVPGRRPAPGGRAPRAGPSLAPLPVVPPVRLVPPVHLVQPGPDRLIVLAEEGRRTVLARRRPVEPQRRPRQLDPPELRVVDLDDEALRAGLLPLVHLVDRPDGPGGDARLAEPRQPRLAGVAGEDPLDVGGQLGAARGPVRDRRVPGVVGVEADDRREPAPQALVGDADLDRPVLRSEEHTSELQSREKLVCRLLLEKKK